MARYLYASNLRSRKKYRALNNSQRESKNRNDIEKISMALRKDDTRKSRSVNPLHPNLWKELGAGSGQIGDPLKGTSASKPIEELGAQSGHNDDPFMVTSVSKPVEELGAAVSKPVEELGAALNHHDDPSMVTSVSKPLEELGTALSESLADDSSDEAGGSSSSGSQRRLGCLG